MKKVSVIVPVEGKGEIINGAIIGETERITAYRLDNGDLTYDRAVAVETERVRKMRLSLYEALGLNGVRYTAEDVIDLFIRNEAEVRKVIYDKRLWKRTPSVPAAAHS